VLCVWGPKTRFSDDKSQNSIDPAKVSAGISAYESGEIRQKVSNNHVFATDTLIICAAALCSMRDIFID